jgi:hypothetical protein
VATKKVPQAPSFSEADHAAWERKGQPVGKLEAVPDAPDSSVIPEPQSSLEFAWWLAVSDGGATSTDATKVFGELVDRVISVGKKGKLTLSVEVIPDEKSMARVTTKATVVTVLPQPDPRSTVFYRNHETFGLQLADPDPDQMSLGEYGEPEAPPEDEEPTDD